MHLRDFFDLIEKFVSVSIVFGVLGFLNKYRAEARRRNNDKAQRTRELLGQLRTAAYVTIWTSLGDGDAEVAMLRIRDELSKRAGTTPTTGSIRDLLADQCLREAIVHDAFTTSNVRVQEDMATFSQIPGDIVVKIGARSRSESQRGHLLGDSQTSSGLRQPPDGRRGHCAFAAAASSVGRHGASR